MCCLLSQNAVQSAPVMSEDDDCFTKANAANTCCTFKDHFFLGVGSRCKIERTIMFEVSSKFANTRNASRMVENICYPLTEKRTTCTRLVSTYYMTPCCVSEKMRSMMHVPCGNEKTDEFLEDRNLCERKDLRTTNRMCLARLPRLDRAAIKKYATPLR